MYDRNHNFGLGPIPKPNPKLANTFGLYHKMENLVTDSMWDYLYHKRAIKSKFAAKYQIFLNYF